MCARLITVLLLVLLVPACKIVVKAPMEGGVTTLSGSYNCDPGEECEVFVSDLFFDETFVAVPNSGFVFRGWKKAHRHFCGNNVDSCHLFTSGFEGNAVLEGFLTRYEVFHLEPSFSAPRPFSLAGMWRYSQKWGNCTATGELEQEFVQGEGVYQTLTEESVQVSGIKPCMYTYAADFSPESRRLGPISTIMKAMPNDFELQQAYDNFFMMPVKVVVVSPDQYRLESEANGEMNITTYTRK